MLLLTHIHPHTHTHIVLLSLTSLRSLSSLPSPPAFYFSKYIKKKQHCFSLTTPNIITPTTTAAAAEKKHSFTQPLPMSFLPITYVWLLPQNSTQQNIKQQKQKQNNKKCNIYKLILHAIPNTHTNTHNYKL